MRTKATKFTRRAAWDVASRLRPSPAAEIVHHRADPLGHGYDELVWAERHGAVLEPQWGYVVAEPWTLRPVSMAVRIAPGDKPMSLRYGTPSLLGLVAAGHSRRTRVIEVERAISLRHFYEWNYYHFYFDVLARLQLIDKVLDDPTIPLVVGPYADELAFARELRAMGAFAERQWIVQPRDMYVRATELYYARPRDRQGATIDGVLSSLRLGDIVASRDERIFLTRRTGGRSLVNEDAVSNMLAARGFRTVDAAALSIGEQIDLLRNTRVLVAIHGAGLTNTMFRRGRPLAIFELCSEGFWSVDFETMASHLGFEHTRVMCESASPGDPQLADLRVDEHELRRLIDGALATCSVGTIEAR